MVDSLDIWIDGESMISFIFVKLTIKMIRGTNHDQDARFADKTKKMLEKSQWPEKYDIKIDLKKVSLGKNII